MVRNFKPPIQNVTVIEGTSWGDCGKGRASHFECQNADIVIRGTGGDNAGHTIVTDGKKRVTHLLPSGIVIPGVMNVISHGVVVNPDTLITEIQELKADKISVSPGNLMISGRAGVIFPFHKQKDALEEYLKKEGKVGTTKRGIGPTYESKCARDGIRMWDLLLPEEKLFKKVEFLTNIHNDQFKIYDFETFDVNEMVELCRKWKAELQGYITNVSHFLDMYVGTSKKIVIEGAQSIWLDLDWGDYPFVTSSNPNTAGTLSGAGIAPLYLKDTIGVAKAHNSRVGEGPFETEMDNEIGDIMRKNAGEYGATTGRPRRCGYFDMVRFKAACKRLGLTKIALNHVDSIGTLGLKLEKQLGLKDGIKICTKYLYNGKYIDYMPEDTEITGCKPIPLYGHSFSGWEIPEVCRYYEDLPREAKRLVEIIERAVEVPVAYIGIGPDNSQTIVR